MPLTTICRRCSTDVNSADRFCQECGFDLKPESESEIGSAQVVAQKGSRLDFSPETSDKFEWPTLEEDPGSPFSKSWASPAFERKSRSQAALSTAELPSFDPQAITHLDQKAANSFETTTDFVSSFSAESAFDAAPNLIITDSPESSSENIAINLNTNKHTHSNSNATIADNQAPVTIPTTNETSGATHDGITSSAAAELPGNKTYRRLHSPLLEKETSSKTIKSDQTTKSDLEKKINNLGMRGGPAMVALDAATVIAVLAFAGALGFWGYNTYYKTKSNEISTNEISKLAGQAQTASKKDEFASTYKSLFALRIMSPNGLSSNQQALFDEAAYQLGRRALEAANETDGLEYLKNVSIDSPRYVKAQELIFQNYAKANGSSAPDMVKTGTKKNGDNSSSNTNSRSNSSNHRSEMLKENGSNEAGASSELKGRSDSTSRIDRNFNRNSNSTNERIQLSSRKVLSIPTLPELDKDGTEHGNISSRKLSGESGNGESTSSDSSIAEDGSISNGTSAHGLTISGVETLDSVAALTRPDSGNGGGVLTFSREDDRSPRSKNKARRDLRQNTYSALKAEHASVPKFSETEISKYNHLLAQYFTRNASNQGADLKEPPSFKEWIKQGQTSF